MISSIYHTVRDPKARYVFRVLDHAGIYVVIVGVIFKSFMKHRLAFLAPVFLYRLWLDDCHRSRRIVDFGAAQGSLMATGWWPMLHRRHCVLC